MLGASATPWLRAPPGPGRRRPDSRLERSGPRVSRGPSHIGDHGAESMPVQGGVSAKVGCPDAPRPRPTFTASGVSRRTTPPPHSPGIDLMTPHERHALYFLAAVALLGAGVQAVRAGDRPAPSRASAEALEAQMAAVDSAIAAESLKASERLSARSRRRKGATSGETEAGFATARRHQSEREGPVDLDRAEQEEIERLPGIGPALAGRIVASRDTFGAFGSLEGLERVRGIGPAMAKRLSPMVTFSGVPRPANAVSSGRSAVPGSGPGPPSRRRGGRQ